MVSPQTLDWGIVPVLCYVEKQITITNESQIEANLSAFLVTSLICSLCNEVKVKPEFLTVVTKSELIKCRGSLGCLLHGIEQIVIIKADTLLLCYDSQMDNIYWSS